MKKDLAWKAEQACLNAWPALHNVVYDDWIVRFSEGFRFLGTIFLKDLLLQPWKPGRKRLKVLSVAPPMPEIFFPQSERRPLRRYRV